MRSRIIHPLQPSARPSLLSLLSLPSLILAGAAFALTPATQPAFAIGSSVGLGTTASYSVLAGQTVTNTGPSTLSGSAGVHPGTAVVGFPPGKVGGIIHAADAQALQAKADLKTAYDDAAGQAADATVGAQLGGRTLVPGVYKAPSSTKITGSLTLDAKGDPDAVFVFQIGSGLTTASSSRVVLLNDAQSCHVFWQVGTSATLGTSTRFVGTIMALTSISLKTGARIEGRALARNGSVTLDNNVLTETKCATSPTTKPSGAASTSTATPTSTTKATATQSATVKATHKASSTPSATAPVSPSGNTPGGLAFTGGGLPVPLIGIAAGAVLMGLTLVLITRRRRIN
ncbi:MAG TPA: ice-binding family protein [Propionicimonas sp.]|uniref:ice-binding family protein n=1 Tax=Propionicimonas sp. TaxID=1955623 RepID=UPI002F43022D